MIHFSCAFALLGRIDLLKRQQQNNYSLGFWTLKIFLQKLAVGQRLAILRLPHAFPRPPTPRICPSLPFCPAATPSALRTHSSVCPFVRFACFHLDVILRETIGPTTKSSGRCTEMMMSEWQMSIPSLSLPSLLTVPSFRSSVSLSCPCAVPCVPSPVPHALQRNCVILARSFAPSSPFARSSSLPLTQMGMLLLFYVHLCYFAWLKKR